MARSRARDADADGLLGSLMGNISQYIVVPLRPRSNGSIKHARMPTSMRSQGPLPVESVVGLRTGGGTCTRSSARTQFSVGAYHMHHTHLARHTHTVIIG